MDSNDKMSSSITTRKKNCCGCNACAEICPKRCITMIADAKGFHYPKVDTTACIDCGLCKKTCPFEEGNIELNIPLTAYAAWNRDRKQHLASSSGGAAYVFSSHIIKQGGVVYGCTSEGMHIRHIRVESLSELPKLQGSKYVQSDIRGLFGQIKSDLKANKPVLFIGTPCQVAGLKNYIKQIPEHLYMVDLICHGVPSQQMLHEHMNYILDNRSAAQLSFREGQLYRIKITSQCGTTYSSDPHKDMYYKAFLDGISYRESCYRCPFACKKRVSDVTIGDFWGLQNSGELISSPSDGISVALINTDKGGMLITSVSEQMNLYERSIKEAVTGNTQLRHPMERTLSQWIFSMLYPIFSFDMAVKCSIIHSRFQTLLRICTNCITYGLRKQQAHH